MYFIEIITKFVIIIFAKFLLLNLSTENISVNSTGLERLKLVPAHQLTLIDINSLATKFPALYSRLCLNIKATQTNLKNIQFSFSEGIVEDLNKGIK